MPRADEVDLRTTYLGLELSSPIVASASPLTRDPDGSRALAEAGVGGIVLPSLFEEEIVAEEVGLTGALEAGSGHFAEALGYFPAVDHFTSALDRYLELLEHTKKVVEVPVIASLNAFSTGGWVRYADLLAEAGADALELNVYRVPTDPRLNATQVEEMDLALVANVCEAVSLPVAVKLSPYYSAMAHFAAKVVGAGAKGLVLFNRFYQPDLDLESMDVVPRVEMSRTWELRLPLRWIAVLRPQLGRQPSLAATSGVYSGYDVVKAIAVGADVAMMTSALLQLGVDHVRSVEDELRSWLADHEYVSSSELRGSVSQATGSDAGEFERANYVKVLHSWTSADNFRGARAGLAGGHLGEVGMEELSRSSACVAGELTRLGIDHDVRQMPDSTRTAPEAAAAVGCDLAQIVKSLIFRAVAGDEAILVLVSGADRVDESRLAEVVGDQVERATADFVRARTGFAIGGVPPVGHTQPVATYIDEHLLGHDLVWAAAGTPHAVFSIKPDDLARVTSARIVAVAAGLGAG